MINTMLRAIPSFKRFGYITQNLGQKVSLALE
jgi:hypothetical protein